MWCGSGSRAGRPLNTTSEVRSQSQKVLHIWMCEWQNCTVNALSGHQGERKRHINADHLHKYSYTIIYNICLAMYSMNLLSGLCGSYVFNKRLYDKKIFLSEVQPFNFTQRDGGALVNKWFPTLYMCSTKSPFLSTQPLVSSATLTTDSTRDKLRKCCRVLWNGRMIIAIRCVCLFPKSHIWN